MTGWEGIYCGPPPGPEDILWQWNFDPWAVFLLLLVTLWAGRSRPGAFAVLVLAVAFLSPLCALSSALFSARVVHHVLLVTLAAPMLALARPARGLVGVALPFLVTTIVFWLWHLPAAYDVALSDMAVYWVMQGSILGSSWIFWRAVFSQPALSGLAWVFLAYLSMGLLGAVLTLAPAALYAAHAVAPLSWGFTPLADQQLGGLVMWMPAALPLALWAGLLARRAWASMATVS